MAEPLGLSRWKTIQQQRVDKLATFLSSEPKTALRATRRTAFLQQMQRAVEVRHQWASAVADNLSAVKDLLEQGAPGATADSTRPVAPHHSNSSRKSGSVG